MRYVIQVSYKLKVEYTAFLYKQSDFIVCSISVKDNRKCHCIKMKKEKEKLQMKQLNRLLLKIKYLILYGYTAQKR